MRQPYESVASARVLSVLVGVQAKTQSLDELAKDGQLLLSLLSCLRGVDLGTSVVLDLLEEIARRVKVDLKEQVSDLALQLGILERVPSLLQHLINK